MFQLEMLEEEILPAAVLAGAFGDDAELIKCDTCEDTHGEDQYASIVMFSSVKIRKKKTTEKVWLVVKFNQESEIFRRSVLTDVQLQNEVFMYENFFRFLHIDEEIIPKFHYGVATGGKNPELDVILLQDLCKENYQVNKNGITLDFSHVAVALHKLAKFHAASYTAKNNDRETFFEKVDHIEEAEWVSEKIKDVKTSLVTVVRKVVGTLVGNKESVDVLENFMDKIKDPYSYMEELLHPVEPLSVVCHGDFCKNNILFKYDENGVPVDAKLVDFGTIRYASPVIDLSYFLFFNTTSALRRKHLDDFLTEYYNVLKLSIGEINIASIEEFEKDFRRKAVYGFLECCIHIPTAVTEPIDWEELALLSTEQIEDYYSNKCNQEATSLLCEVLRDLIYFKCIL